MKKIFITLAIILILIGSGFLFWHRPSLIGKNILNCEEALDAAQIFTTTTSDVFNGMAVSEATAEAKKQCSKIRSINDCHDSVCKMIVGTKSDSLKDCNGDHDCLAGYSLSHIRDCEELSNDKKTEVFKNICLISRAHTTKNTSECDKIDEISSMDATKDGRFNESYYFSRNKCLWGVSDQTDDMNICENMTDSQEKDLCFFSYAIKTKDSNVCNKISLKYFTNAKELCLDYKKISAKELKRGILNLIK